MLSEGGIKGEKKRGSILGMDEQRERERERKRGVQSVNVKQEAAPAR